MRASSRPPSGRLPSILVSTKHGPIGLAQRVHCLSVGRLRAGREIRPRPHQPSSPCPRRRRSNVPVHVPGSSTLARGTAGIGRSKQVSAGQAAVRSKGSAAAPVRSSGRAPRRIRSGPPQSKRPQNWLVRASQGRQTGPNRRGGWQVHPLTHTELPENGRCRESRMNQTHFDSNSCSRISPAGHCAT